MAEYILGIDVGGTKIALGVLDAAYTLCARTQFPFDPAASAESIYAMLLAHIGSCLHEAGVEPAQISHIGLGVPGTIRPDRRALQFATNAKLLNDFPLCDMLQRSFPGAAIRMENDANAAALAEHILGAGKGSRDMLYCTISTGVGCGLILNGALYHGANMAAGELGHMIVREGGALCGCGGKGCAEAYAGGANYPAHIRARIEAGEQTVMAALAAEQGSIDGKVLAAALAQNDAMAKEVLDDICQVTALLFYNVYKLLGMETFVVGGGLTNLGDLLFAGIRAHMDGLRTPMDASARWQVLPAHFSSVDIGVYGAALSAF